MTEVCAKCKEVGEDRRTLWMACLYEMNELGIPFDQKELELMHTDRKQHFYTLRVCKDCRADWMTMIKIWWDAPLKEKESCGSGIFIRHYGTNVEITAEEFAARYPGLKPVRFVDE
jgi:hypothetical protein